MNVRIKNEGSTGSWNGTANDCRPTEFLVSGSDVQSMQTCNIIRGGAGDFHRPGDEVDRI